MPLPCYFINLDRSVARREHMETMFRSLSLKATRVSAIDGRNADLEEWRLTASEERWHRTLTGPEIGCFLSHRKTWQMIVDQPDAYAAVFEDDIQLSSDAAALLGQADWIPESAECVKIDTSSVGGIFDHQRETGFRDFTLMTSRGDLRGTAGYIISRRAAQSLLDQTPRPLAPIDVQMFNRTHATFLNWDFLQLIPALCIQQSLDQENVFLPANAEISLIAQGKPRMKFGYKKVLRELKRPFNQLHAQLSKYSFWKVFCNTPQRVPFRK